MQLRYLDPEVPSYLACTLCMIQGCYSPPPCGCCGPVVLAAGGSPPLRWFWWSCPCRSAPPLCGPSGCCGPVVLVVPPLCEKQPVLYSPLYSTDIKAVGYLFSTLRHRGAGSPYTGTLGIGHHALVFRHVTALACNSKLHPVVPMLCC